MEIVKFQDRYYTAVMITADDGTTVLGRGAARCDPKDRFNPEIGQQLALGRALENAGKRVLKRANGLVKHADDVADMKATRQGWEPFVKTKKAKLKGGRS